MKIPILMTMIFTYRCYLYLGRILLGFWLKPCFNINLSHHHKTTKHSEISPKQSTSDKKSRTSLILAMHPKKSKTHRS